jgi:hypothetical protein
MRSGGNSRNRWGSSRNWDQHHHYHSKNNGCDQDPSFTFNKDGKSLVLPETFTANKGVGYDLRPAKGYENLSECKIAVARER